MRIRPWAVAVLATALVSALTACGGSDSGDSAGTNAAAGSSAQFPVRIASALGPATIKKAPQRVVAIGWGSQDAALALGVVPVGMEDLSADAGTPNGLLPWDEQRITELKGKTPTLIKTAGGQLPIEKIAALNPDLILAVYSGITAAQYQQLSRIAPTVAYPDKPWITSWQDQIDTVGKALGMTKQAATLKRKTQELVRKAASEHPEFTGRTIAFGSATTPGNYNFYYDDDPRMQLLKQLGFTLAPSVSTLGAGGSPSSFAKQISIERLDSIKTDVLVAWYLDKQTQKNIEANKLFQRIPAVKNGGYIPLTDPPLVYATSAVNVLSLPWMLQKYLPLLSKAARATAP